MASSRLLVRPMRMLFVANHRQFSTSFTRFGTNERVHDNVEEHRKAQTEKPLNPHMTNTNSTIANEFPSVGKDKPPPEFISSVDGNFVPKDSKPENTHRMVGGTQDVEPENGANVDLEVGEMGVGEIEGGSFKVEPLRRTGEDANTIRARLLYQSRKRGTLESDLLLSTFADANLASMSMEQLQQYDVFLDENDWDIYYWATQEPPPTSHETAEGAGPALATKNAQGTEDPHHGTDAWRQGKPRSGEWAQTVGTFKPAYRPVPARWKHSEVLAMLKKHVKHRSAGGVHELESPDAVAAVERGVDTSEARGGRGMGFMPPVRNFDV